MQFLYHYLMRSVKLALENVNHLLTYQLITLQKLGNCIRQDQSTLKYMHEVFVFKKKERKKNNNRKLA